MRKLIANIAIVVSAVAFALSGVASSPVANAAPSKTQITFWSWNPSQSMMQTLVSAFERQNPNIAVDFKPFTYANYLVALKAAANAGAMPTVFGLQVGALAKEYVPLAFPLDSDASATFGATWKSRYLELSQATVTNPPGDSHVYFLPLSTLSTSLVVNKSWFTKFGVPIPNTLSQLFADAKVFNSHNQPLMVMGAKEGWEDEDVFLQVANQTGPGEWFKAEETGKGFTAPGLVEAMTIWQELFTKNVVQKGALGQLVYPTMANAFQTNGEGGMMPLGSWNLQDMLPSFDVPLAKNWTFIQFPKVCSSCIPTPLAGIDVLLGLSKSASPAVRAAGWKFIAFLTQGGGQTIYGNALFDLPAKVGFVPSTLGEAYPGTTQLFNQSVAWAKKGTLRYVLNPNLDAALITALQNVASGGSSPMEALAGLSSALSTP